jgi:hypothetical protein
MPSDTRPSPEARSPLEALRHLLAPAQEAHRTALEAALEDARGALRTFRPSGNGHAGRAARELGALALGPIDPERFALLLDREEGLDPDRLELFEKAVSVLEEAVTGARAVTEVKVDEGGSLAEAVEGALRDRGRGFGAVRTLALLRTGEGEGDAGELLAGLPFRSWRTLERALAPPLLVRLKGRDLDTISALTAFLDGGAKIVLLPEGPCPPAPLARLIAPGILVIQSDEVAELEPVSGTEGTAVAALVPPSAAAFIHDPAAEEEATGLRIRRLPESRPRAWVGGMSPAQQARDLEVLEAWSRGRGAPGQPPGRDQVGAQADTAAGETDPTPSDPLTEPAERLAAWLLSRAGLDEAGEG